MKDEVCGAGCSSAWTVTSSYILGPWTDEIVCFVDRTADSDPPPRYYFTKDRLNSTRELINASATVMTSYDYDVWGSPTESHLSGNISTRYRAKAAEWSSWVGTSRLALIRPAVWAWARGVLGWRARSLWAPASSAVGLQPDPLCDWEKCFIEGCQDSADCQAGGEGNWRLRYCMRRCMCAYNACVAGWDEWKLTQSKHYCPYWCCSKHYNWGKCYRPCNDWGGDMRDKAECWKTGERLRDGYKECQYNCFYYMSGKPTLVWKKMCKAPVDRECYEMVWASDSKCYLCCSL